MHRVAIPYGEFLYEGILSNNFLKNGRCHFNGSEVKNGLFELHGPIPILFVGTKISNEYIYVGTFDKFERIVSGKIITKEGITFFGNYEYERRLHVREEVYHVSISQTPKKKAIECDVDMEPIAQNYTENDMENHINYTKNDKDVYLNDTSLEVQPTKHVEEKMCEYEDELTYISARGIYNVPNKVFITFDIKFERGRLVFCKIIKIKGNIKYVASPTMLKYLCSHCPTLGFSHELSELYKIKFTYATVEQLFDYLNNYAEPACYTEFSLYEVMKTNLMLFSGDHE